ncbi:MAG TPA: amidohydrolase [Gemmatimonadaceae bacterium]|nr:amidohydrolase [Gemmatimonadaceae bacterium]
MPPHLPSLAVVNARIWTGSPRRPWADGLAVRGERIAAVGSSAQVRKMVDAGTRIIDARGVMLVPGFIDSHVHFMEGGFQLASVQLRDAATPQEFTARLEAFAGTVPSGSWITGGDWDHELWGGTLPTHEWIDAATARNPVWINRLDAHMSLANSLAMHAAHVDAQTPDVEGGTIVRDADGNPTGIFKDNARRLIDAAVSAPTPEREDAALDAAMHHVAALGVTSVVHMGTWPQLAIFERAHAAGRLITRIYAAVPLDSWARLRDRVAAGGRGDARLRIGLLKGFADGSLGSQTAAFLQPYSSAPHDSGLLVTPPDALYEWTREADHAGLQVAIHAIGDRAVREVLNIYERAERANGTRDRRFRMEHAQHIAPADLPRFAELQVVASMQPIHAIDDGRWAEKVIGAERIATAYACHSLLAHHTRLAFGSDWNVAPPTPLEGIYAAVTRRTRDGLHPEGWVPEQKIGVDDALRAYTMGGAYAECQEREKGTLESGKLADFVLIDRDITRIPPAEIRDARVLMTVVGGAPVYEEAGCWE